MERGELDRAERDRLVTACSSEVVRNVLEDNRRQILAISIAEGFGSTLLDRHERVMLEHLLDRAQEELPSAAEIAARRERGEGLCGPEIAVLLTHSKNILQRRRVPSGWGGGQHAAKRLRRANLPACGIGLPDTTVDGDMNGLRIGTPELVRLGMTPADMPELAALIARGLAEEVEPERVAPAVTAWRKRFTGIHYTMDQT